MNTATLLKTATALPLVAMLALAGCGGGGSSSATKQLTALQEALGDTELTPEAITALITAQMMAESERNAAQTSRDAANAEVTRLMSALQAAEDARDQALAGHGADQDNIDSLNAQIVDLTSQIADLNTEITGLNMQIAELTALEGQLAMADAELTRLMSALQAAEDARDQALVDDQADQDNIDSLSAQIAALTSQIASRTQQFTNLTGLASSTATKIVATDSTEIGTFFSTQPNTSYSPVSGGLRMDYNADTAALERDLHVHSVQRSSAGGYLIVYTDGQTQHTVEFRPEHCSSGYCEISNGSYHGFWSWTSSDNEPMGPPRFSYLHALHLVANTAGEESRITFVFGVTTPPETLQTLGEAFYRGYFRSDAHRTADNAGALWQRYQGNVRLVANFDMSQLYGTIVDVRGSQPGSSTDAPFPTSSFRISEGKIHDNGQFTATLTGMDSDDAVLDRDSVRGVMGQILGEFYGPNGEELGGAVTATRDLTGEDNDLVFHGHIHAQKERDIAIDGSAQLSAIVHRDWENNETSQSGTTAKVEPTSDGYRITFTINGTSEIIEVTEADLGALDASSNTYAKSVSTATESKRGYLWRKWGSFPGQPQLDYLDVNAISFFRYTPGVEQDPSNFIDSEHAFVVRGTRTTVSDMPSGTATYSGRLEAKEWDTTMAGSIRTSPEYRGDFTMTADFGAGSVMAAASSVGRRPGSRRGSYDYANYTTTGLTFQGTVSGNAITASAISGTGEFAGYSGSPEGAFYGPQVAEVGGVFSGENAASNKVLHGWFAGDKQ